MTSSVPVLPKLNVTTSVSSNYATQKTDQSVSYPVTITTTTTAISPKNTKSTVEDDHFSKPGGICCKVSRRLQHKCYYRHRTLNNTSHLLPVIGQQKSKEFLTENVQYSKIDHQIRNKSIGGGGGGSVPPPPRVTSMITSVTKKISESTISDPGNYYVENEYTKFSRPTPYPLVFDKKHRESIIRSQRLFRVTKQLKKCHEEYNKLRGIVDRDKFLTKEILQRYILALDLALTERCRGIALEITQKMYDATKYMLPLYSHIFYLNDGTHSSLPVVVNGDYNFIKSLSPIIYALNRTPQSQSIADNSQLRLEVHLMKLLLEMLLLVVAPVESVIFRATLEVVSNTAYTAYRRLVSLDATAFSVIRWQNNSVMKQELVEILEKFGLADEYGCKGSLRKKNLLETRKSGITNFCDSELEMSDE